jgi:hypothetical protein
MPDLNSDDCSRIIDNLAEFGFLGALQGKPRADQLREFLVRSRKQLLVAMKEATSGRGFDAIIADEYDSLSADARVGLRDRLRYIHARRSSPQASPPG